MVDYNMNVAMPNPLGGFLQGWQIGEAIKQQRAQQQQMQAQQAIAQRMQQALGSLRPDSGAGEFASLVQQFPDLVEPLTKQYAAFDGARKTALFDAGQRAFALLRPGVDGIGGAEEAVADLEKSAQAFENSRQPAIAQQLRDAAKGVRMNPGAARQSLGMMLAFADPEKFDKVGKAMKTQAESQSAETEAALAAERRPFDLSKARAESVIKEAEAKFAPKKLLADLGLTQARIAGERASTQASLASAAAARATASRAEAEAGQIRAGIIPADKRPEAEGKFRKEYSDQTKGYQEVKAAYGRILSSDQSAAGDLSLIFNYMKMLDPGSVVREAEFANAQNATGVPDRIRNLYNNILSGERLNPNQRKEFSEQAQRLYTQARTQEATVRKGIERIAKGYGLKPENIFYEPEETAPAAPSNAPGTGVFRVVGRRQP